MQRTEKGRIGKRGRIVTGAARNCTGTRMFENQVPNTGARAKKCLIRACFCLARPNQGPKLLIWAKFLTLLHVKSKLLQTGPTCSSVALEL